MNKTEAIIAEAMSLPVQIRAQLIDKLLRSMNPTCKEVDDLWAREAEKRVEEVETGRVKTMPGQEVFKKVRKRLKK